MTDLAQGAYDAIKRSLRRTGRCFARKTGSAGDQAARQGAYARCQRAYAAACARTVS